jgi:sarcosine oxidase subunit beta
MGVARSADVVVVGGGVMGLHVAWKLAAARAGRVVLFEKRAFGAGESGKSGAILRQHYSQATLVAMARASLAEYAQLHERAEGGIGLRRPGMLFLCDEKDRPALERNVALQRGLGVPVELLEAKELRRLEPRAAFEDDAVAALERDSAFVDPARTLAAIAREARAAGAQLDEGARVVEISVERGGSGRRVVSVALADGRRVETRTVVNCGGPWAGRLCRQLGLALPFEVVRPEQAFFAPPPRDRRDDPCERIFADLPNGAYWKSEPSGLTRVGLLSWERDEKVADPDHYDEGASGSFLADCRARLARRIPAYADAVCWGGCGALYTITPDAQAMIGRVEGLDGFLVCSGFSGHGFKLGPSVGLGVAALLAGGDPAPLDPDFFSPARFARSQTHSGVYGYSVLG